MLWLDTLPSTQSFLKESNLPIGSVVVANTQTQGRGRHGRVWQSQEGGLYFSFLIDTDFRDFSTLPLVLGYSISEFIDSQGIPSAIKWINDVFVKGKKVAGVLVEKTKKGFVCGIGLNVNQESFPQDLQAISMFLADGKKRNRVDVLLELLSYIGRTLEEFKLVGFPKFREAIKSKLLFLEQEVIIYGEKPIVGILQDIGEDGSLVLLTSKGNMKIVSGDLTLRGLGI